MQALRARAEAVGTLQDTDQQHVCTSDQAIVIEPAQFDYVYVPVYDPLVAMRAVVGRVVSAVFLVSAGVLGYPVHWHGVGIVWGRPASGRPKPLGLGSSRMAGGRIDVTIGRNEFFNRPTIPQLPRQRFAAARARTPAWRRLWKCAGERSLRQRRTALIDARRESRAGVPSAAPGRQATAPQTASRLSAGALPILRATPQTAPGYRQASPDSPGTSQKRSRLPAGAAGSARCACVASGAHRRCAG